MTVWRLILKINGIRQSKNLWYCGFETPNFKFVRIADEDFSGNKQTFQLSPRSNGLKAHTIQQDRPQRAINERTCFSVLRVTGVRLSVDVTELVSELVC